MSKSKIDANFLIRKQDDLQIVPLEVYCLDGRIIEIHRKQNKNDICDGVIIPAFFNMHSHLGESVFCDIDGNDWTITKYLEYTEKYNAGLTQEQKASSWIESAKYSVEEMYLQGTVGFCAARSSSIASEYDMLTMSGYPIMNSRKLADFKKAGAAGFRSFWDENKSNTSMIGIFLHSVYANDAESFVLARKCLDMGAEFITVHVSEDEVTTELEKQTHNMSAITLLKQYGLLSEKTILVHCGCCSDEDLMLVKKSGAAITVCPISNKFLNAKMIDVRKLEAMDIPWCISTDGLGTGRSFSLLDQIECIRNEYPDISWCKYWSRITSVPGSLFQNNLYTGDIEVGTKSTFLRTEYNGTDVHELIEGLVEGKIGFKPMKV